MAFLRASDKVLRICSSDQSRVCAQELFGLVDITGNGELSPAEIARVFRAVGPLIGYSFVRSQAAGQSPKIGDVYGMMVLLSLISPMFASSLIESYDFDLSGSVSLEELLQDRGDDEFMGALGTLGSASIETAFSGLIKGLVTVLAGVRW